jgi:valyl-tRNA synthetase
VPGAGGLLMARRWPVPDAGLIDAVAEAELARAIGAVQELRGWRDRVGAAPGAVLPARLEAEGYERTAEYVARLTRCRWVDATEEAAATVAVPGGAVAVLPSGAVDTGAEQRRIDERRAWLGEEIARAERKLANPGFVAKAKEAVVTAERDKLARLQEELAAL